MTRTLPPVPGPTALITGVSGQDGIYLARHLLDAGYRVVGIVAPGEATTQSAATLPATGSSSARSTSATGRPCSPRSPRAAPTRDLQPGRDQLGRAELVGARCSPTPSTPVRRQHLVEAALALRDRHRGRAAAGAGVVGRDPRRRADSPYARSKAAAEEIVRAARDDHGLHASCAILANHESPVRPVTFVTRKITRAVAEIAAGRRDAVTLGNLEVKRDWGFAGDHVAAMAAARPRSRAGRRARSARASPGRWPSCSAWRSPRSASRTRRPTWRRPDLVRPADAAVVVADPEPAEAAARVAGHDILRGGRSAHGRGRRRAHPSAASRRASTTSTRRAEDRRRQGVRARTSSTIRGASRLETALSSSHEPGPSVHAGGFIDAR